MGVSDAAAAMVLLQTRRTVDLAGREIARAIERQQVTALEIDEAFQGFAALQAAEDVLVQRPHIVGLDGVEYGPHLRVAGNALDAVNGAKVVVGVLAALVEGQQGRVLEGEHGEGRHQGVAEGNVDLAGPQVANAVEAGANQSEERVSGKILASLPGRETHSWQLLLPQ